MNVSEIIDFMDGLYSDERESLALDIIDRCAGRVYNADIIEKITQFHQEMNSMMFEYWDPELILERYCDKYGFDALVDHLIEQDESMNQDHIISEFYNLSN